MNANERKLPKQLEVQVEKRFSRQVTKLPHKIKKHWHDKQSRLLSGEELSHFGGKLLHTCPRFPTKRHIRITLRDGYRVILELLKEGFRVLWIGTHQKYSKFLSQPQY